MGKINPIGFRVPARRPTEITLNSLKFRYMSPHKLSKNFIDFQRFYLFMEEFFLKKGYIISDYNIQSSLGNKKIATFYLFQTQLINQKKHPSKESPEIKFEDRFPKLFFEKLFSHNLSQNFLINFKPTNLTKDLKVSIKSEDQKNLTAWSRTPFFMDGLEIISLMERRPPENKGYGAPLLAKFISLHLKKSSSFNHQRIMEFFGQGLSNIIGEDNSKKAGFLKGFTIQLKGRVSGGERTLKTTFKKGPMPLHTIKANIDYSYEEAHTPYGTLGVKVWLNYTASKKSPN